MDTIASLVDTPKSPSSAPKHRQEYRRYRGDKGHFRPHRKNFPPYEEGVFYFFKYNFPDEVQRGEVDMAGRVDGGRSKVGTPEKSIAVYEKTEFIADC